MEKISVLNNLEREKFRLELNSEEYDCYSTSQKDMIMQAIRLTDWDLSFVRIIFQSNSIKIGIDYFLQILLSTNSKHFIISNFADFLLRGILQNLQGGIDILLAAKLLDQFTKDYMVLYTSDNYYSTISEKRMNAIFKYSYDVLFDDAYRKLISGNIIEIFESLVKATDIGIDIGFDLFSLYNKLNDIHFDHLRKVYSVKSKYSDKFKVFEMDKKLNFDKKVLELITMAYEGVFDNNQDIITIVQECGELFTQNYDDSVNLLDALSVYAQLISEETLVQMTKADLIEGNFVPKKEKCNTI
ncbi:MAG: hypothetical protein HFI73_03385 [Bacilli bacterium]|jgi:hypothetical protein|nr:hypothetical protein [Bacilli bacterium]